MNPRIKQFVDDAKAVILSGFAMVDDATLDARAETCGACPHYDNGCCGICTCRISIKARFAAEHCPLGKWPGEQPVEQPYVEEATRKARMSICEACPSRSGRRCKRCTCDITTLTRLTKGKCPQDKWE